jgi:hypothetical protein
MNQQESNLPRSIQILGRFKLLIGCMVGLGVLGGLAFAAFTPTASTSSQALVTFTAPSWSCPQGAICGTPVFGPGYVQGQLIKVVPAGVQIKVLPGNVVSVTATGVTAVQAQKMANVVAWAYASQAGSLSYMGVQPSVTVTHPAGIGSVAASPKQLFNDALLGAVAGLLLGVIAALAGGQTMIDPVTMPRGPAGGEGGEGGGSAAGSGEADRGARYGSSGFSLQQLAAEQVARSDELARSERFSPFPGEGLDPRIG